MSSYEIPVKILTAYKSNGIGDIGIFQGIIS